MFQKTALAGFYSPPHHILTVLRHYLPLRWLGERKGPWSDVGLWPCLGLKPGGQYKKRTRPTLDFSALPCHTFAGFQVPATYRLRRPFWIFRLFHATHLPASRCRPPFVETSRPSNFASVTLRPPWGRRNKRPRLHHQESSRQAHQHRRLLRRLQCLKP